MDSSSRKPSESQPNRMGALAKLPVFLDLRGKHVVLAGESNGAAWKAELLAACGAHVHIYAAHPSDDLLALLGRGAADGTLTHHARPWAIDVFSGAALAVGDCESAEEAMAFRCAAKAAGVPVNTVDKPETCDFQFGSIVNRSPVVIGISTDGAAPILGQAIRRKIEALLPPSLADWAAKAQEIRDQVMVALRPGAERRGFWERFSDLAFSKSGSLSANFATMIENVRLGLTDQQGRVTLVGAGPGDAELLTLRAVRALQSADVILYDDLVSEDVLELARREAKRVQVGKRGRRDSCKQEDINALMLSLAKEGKNVLRLKSGDPMVFGRAGEEIADLAAAGIPVEVVPGITSAQAMAARLGISLTHRDFAQSLTLMTGHSRDGDLPGSINWQAAADPHRTTIIYMGGRVAAKIRDQLIAAGMAPDTPAIAIASISRENEARWLGPVSALWEGVQSLPQNAPILIGIGRVFGTIIEKTTIAE